MMQRPSPLATVAAPHDGESNRTRVAPAKRSNATDGRSTQPWVLRARRWRDASVSPRGCALLS
jgi:hypothetical protein